MNIVFLPKGKGKTSITVSTSAVTGVPILCLNERQKELIYKTAKELDLKIPTPIILGSKESIPQVLIDNAEVILQTLVKKSIGADVIGITMNDEKPPKLPKSYTFCLNLGKLCQDGSCINCNEA